MFRTGFLPIIRSLVLYTQQQVFVIQVMLTGCSQHNLYLLTLFSKDDKGLLTSEVQILGPDHADELGDGFIIQ